jgi:hypothetical protein
MRFSKTRYILVVVLSLVQSYCFSQSNEFSSELINYSSTSNQSAQKFAPEKLYLQFDKPYYAIGDTIWFKAYLFNAAYVAAFEKSGIMYIDIASDSNKVIKQYKLPVVSGSSWGNISLDVKDFNTGTYTIRAYTNWMRNFGDLYFFYKSFYISGSNENNLLINTLFSRSAVNGNNVLSAKLLFSDINKIPFRVTPLQLEVMSGNKHLYKQKLQTGVDGILDVNFNIPEKSSNLVLLAESEQKDKKAIIPINLNRPENADIQFLPEGGNLVAGLPAHIGFKVIGEDGKGIDISGIITDHNQNQLTQFKSLHNGIGSFDLAIQVGESYTAKVTLPGGVLKEYPLPVAKSIGIVLKVKNTMENDSLTVSVAATNDIVQSGNSYFLIGKARGIVCYAAVFNFNESNSMQRKIAKSLFPTGITHFTILTTKYQPLNERLVYIDHHDNLHIQFIANKQDYSSRDSVALKIKVTDNKGNPVSGNFSLAVTDDTQVKTDTLNKENILTRMLLTSDLKGYVEEPSYYLTSKTIEAWQALDNLLLTQGWIGYDWQQVFSPPTINYQPEKDFIVTGSVINVFNKPVKGTNVLLFSKSPPILVDTLTDKDGKFIFEHFPRVDTPVFVIKAVNKNGKSFNVGIKIDEVKPPDFIKPVSPLVMPWYVNSDSILLNYTKNHALIKQQENFPMGGHILKEVKISAKKIVHGSQNLNGPGEADVVLDEKDLEAEGKKTWLRLLKENVKGLRESDLILEGTSSKASKDPFLFSFITERQGDDIPIHFQPVKPWYFINDKPVKFFIDGISLYKIYKPSGSAFNDVTTYLNSHSAEDIKGIEVMVSSKYSMRYIPNEWSYAISSDNIAFVEITTRSGNGPGIDNTPGMYLYKPLPISRPKQFYKPKYTVKDTTKHLPDLRSTIDWEPNVTTDAKGEAKLWFYAADKPSTYTITIEGTDMNGNLGYKQGKLNVGKREDKAK